jgi:DNA-binding CsgD family transcriptional regulator
LRKKLGMKLTKRQSEIMTLLESGCTTRQIADRLKITERVVIYHIANVRRRWGASSRAQLMALLVLKRTRSKNEDSD